jgi:hypothetical protein
MSDQRRVKKPKNVPLCVRLTQQHWEMLARLAEKEELNPSAMIRTLIVREARHAGVG